MPPPTTFFFYDLETSGFRPQRDRIMQFAGQRTDLDLRPVGEPVNVLVRLTDEVLPSPGAILITGITPQQTVRDGITEAQLAKLLEDEVFTPGTCVVGFNNVRFDDTFIRFLFYRNFYDPYAWCYADGRSRWDLLDAMRMARALRPDGFTWPVDEEGRPVNKLAMLSAANGFVHTRAHDALSDVEALIGVARHLRSSQPKFFSYLLGMRSKGEVTKLVNLGQPKPFVYTSGRYPSEYHHTTVALPVAAGKNNSLLVYDLRHDPARYASISPEELAAMRFPTKEDRAKPDFLPFPAKELMPGNCPAVAPLATLDSAAEVRVGLERETALRHAAALAGSGLVEKLVVAMKPRDFPPQADPDAALYDGFLGDGDKRQGLLIRRANPDELAALTPEFKDRRLPELFLRYKARNFPGTLRDDEREQWESYRTARLAEDWPGFMTELEKAAATDDPAVVSLLTDLQLWAQSIAPGE